MSNAARDRSQRLVESDISISVIVPVYNAESYLERCIDSILSEQDVPFELILVNDGSTDASGDLCRKYTDIDSRVKLIQKSNGGVSSARNAGLHCATGKWITFVDADDSVAPGYLSTLEQASKELNNTNGIVVTGYHCVDQSSGLLLRRSSWKYRKCRREDPGFFEILHRLYLLPGYPFGKLLNRSLIQTESLQFDTRFSYGEDRLFILHYLIRCDAILSLPEDRYIHTLNTGGLSERYNDFESEYQCFLEVADATTKLFGVDFEREIKGNLLNRLKRVIACLYISGSQYTREERLQRLKMVWRQGERFGGGAIYLSSITEALADFHFRAYYRIAHPLIRVFKKRVVWPVRTFGLSIKSIVERRSLRQGETVNLRFL